MSNNNIWMIVGVALVVAVVASIITANITGNTIKLNADTNGVYNVYTKMESDATLANLNSQITLLNSKITGLKIPSIGTYMNPRRCFLNISSTRESYTDNNGNIVYSDSMTATCNSNQFIGEVTHIDCSNFANIRVIVGTGWADNTLPNSLSYTCVDANTGAWTAPTQIYAYCCDIANNGWTGPIIGPAPAPVATAPSVAKMSKVDPITKRVTVI